MKKIDKVLNILNSVPFYGNYNEIEELSNIFSQVSLKIENSDNARDLIFEVWFLYDFYIRKLILKAFDLSKYENPDLDLMYTLLPQSFDSCLITLSRILKNQRKIYNKEMHPLTKINLQTEKIHFQGWFLVHLIREKPELYEELTELYDKYLKENEPKYHDYIKSKRYKEPNFEIVSRIWINNCSSLNDEWFDNVRKLNLCRNKAAHIYDDSQLYKVFGINGQNKLNKLKTIIKELLRSTMRYED